MHSRFARILPLAATMLSFGAALAAPAYVPDHKALAADDDVVFILKSAADVHRFDEIVARRLVPMLLMDGLTTDEQDLLYELASARTPVAIRTGDNHNFDMPPPDANARDYLNLLKSALESTNLETMLDARWLQGAPQMKDIVDLSTMGQALNGAVATYVARKLAATLIDPANGETALKDLITKARMQMAQSDADTERGGKALLVAGLRTLERNTTTKISAEIYDSLK